MRHYAWSALFMVPALVAQAPSPEAQRIERLVGIGKLWGKIRVLHPDLASKSIDWDKALVDAIAKINSAKSRPDYADAVRGMLSALRDPATELLADPRPSLLNLPKDLKPFSWIENGKLVVHLNDPSRFMNTYEEVADYLTTLKLQIRKASYVIFDLRPDKSSQKWTSDERGLAGYYLGSVIESLVPELIDCPLQLPAKRVRAHLGYRGDADNGYSAGVFLEGGKEIQPLGRRKELAFLVNDQSSLPGEVMALKKSGQALVVTEGGLDRDWSAIVTSFEVGEGLSGNFRKADWVFADGSTGCQADLQVSASTSMNVTAPGILAVMNQWTHPELKIPPEKAARASLVPKFRADAAYGEMPFPGREYRILAAIKFWTTIDWFFPYKSLMDRPWDTVLDELIPALEGTRDVQTYQLAISAMVARIQDSHGSVELAQGSIAEVQEPEGLKAYFGTGAIPVALAMIEGRPVVIRTWADSKGQENLQLGDEILRIDGESAQARMDRIRPFISASTTHRLDFRVVNWLLRGPIGKAGVIEIRRANGDTTTRKVTWSESGPVSNGAWRTGPEFRMLKGNIGYVDLDRLRSDQVQSVMDTMGPARAVILDLRGYPTAAVPQILGCFAKNPNATSARFRIPLFLGEPDSADGPLSASSSAKMYATPRKAHPGQVVILIDERAQSQAENWGLGLEAASGATFVGSPTSGANGSVTTVVLPGSLRVFFTGMDVRHGDGRQLQRVGLQPHIAVRPTIKGIAEGRDEVLERAIRFVEEGR